MGVSANLVFLGLVTGLGFGAVYVLISMSYNLVLAASGVFNFAIANFVMVAVIFSFVLRERIEIAGPLVLLVLLIGGALAGAISEFVTVRPFLRRVGNLTEDAVVSTLGLGLAIASAAQYFFGSNSYRVPDYVSDTPLMVGGVPVRPIFIVVIIVGLLLTFLIEYFISRSALGSVLRATIADRDGAAILGINTDRVILWSFVGSGLLAGLAGFLLAPLTGASAFVGQDLSLVAFVAMALGGFGSFRGVIFGGALVGLVTSMTPVFLNAAWTQPVLYLVLVAALVIRPTGLFGNAGEFGASAMREV